MLNLVKGASNLISVKSVDNVIEEAKESPFFNQELPFICDKTEFNSNSKFPKGKVKLITVLETELKGRLDKKFPDDIPPYAQQIDILRYIILTLKGGCYIDWDLQNVNPDKPMLLPKDIVVEHHDDVMAYLMPGYEYANGCLISMSNSESIQKMLLSSITLQNMKSSLRVEPNHQKLSDIFFAMDNIKIDDLEYTDNETSIAEKNIAYINQYNSEKLLFMKN